MREALGGIRFEPDSFDETGYVALRLCAGAGEAVEQDRLGQDRADAHAAVERRVGILEDHLDRLAQRPDPAGRAFAGNALPAIEHAARGGAHEARDDIGDGGLAAAGFAHEPEHFAAADGEGDIVHRAEAMAFRARKPAAGGVVDAQVLDRQDGRFIGNRIRALGLRAQFRTGVLRATLAFVA